MARLTYDEIADAGEEMVPLAILASGQNPDGTAFTLPITTSPSELANAGRAFVIGSGRISLAVAGNVRGILQNPVGSGVNVIVAGLTIFGTGTSWTTLYLNPTAGVPTSPNRPGMNAALGGGFPRQSNHASGHRYDGGAVGWHGDRGGDGLGWRPVAGGEPAVPVDHGSGCDDGDERAVRGGGGREFQHQHSGGSGMTESVPAEGQAETLRAVNDDESRPCEVCNQPVPSDDRWEILRSGGPAWRHPWHTDVS